MVDGSLKNLGHTCYFNSVLQAMFGLERLTALLKAVSGMHQARCVHCIRFQQTEMIS
jgi:ubiquitin C-terminal hydrolase